MKVVKDDEVAVLLKPNLLPATALELLDEILAKGCSSLDVVPLLLPALADERKRVRNPPKVASVDARPVAWRRVGDLGLGLEGEARRGRSELLV